MKLRDALTLIGGILGALGPVFIMASESSAMWWIGMSFAAVSPVLLSYRAINQSKR
jgi:hypothetical protein